jgi:hypothetical protein
MYQWIVLLHIVGAFMFVASHGVAMWMAAQLPGERDPRRIGALLDLSSASLSGVYLGFVLLLVGGIWAGIDGGHFGRGWIWAALVLLTVITVVMYAVASPYFGRLREAVGVRSRYAPKDAPIAAPLTEAEIAAIAAKSPLAILTVVGFGGILIILWLMVVKPF